MTEAIENHREFLSRGDLELRRRTKRVEQVVRVVSERLHKTLWSGRGYEARVRDFLERGTAPYDVAELVLEEIQNAIPEAATCS